MIRKTIATISAILILISAQPLIAQNGNKSFEFDDFFKNYTFYAPGVRGYRSMKDGISYSVSEGRGSKLVVKSYENGEVIKTLIDLKTLNSEVKAFSDYSFNTDETKILLTTDREDIYRRSYKAAFYIYDIATGKLTPVSANGKQQLATFSPDGNKIAFVRDNNLFYTDLSTGKEIQITTDGKTNEIINGAPDWVYEEEFEFNKAFEWSTDGAWLAWIRFDESKVSQFSMSMFQGAEPALDENKLYPGVSTFKYPKAGDANSVVTVHSYNLVSGEKKTMDIGDETDIYIPRIRFTQDPSILAIFRLNRLQNHFEILFTNPSNGIGKVIYTENNKCYLDEKYFDDIQFLEDKQNFTLMSERDGYAHIYIYNLKGEMVSQVTKGEFDVTDLNGCDVKNKLIYYTSAQPLPYQREIHCVKWDGKDNRTLNEKPGSNRATFSEGFKFYTITHSDVKTPPEVTLYNSKGKAIKTLADGKAISDKLKDYKFGYREFFSFKTSDDVMLYGWMLKPAEFDASKKYPVFMTQYSGPNSQSALDAWDLGWEDYLAAKGYIIVCVDGRGTGSRGEAFRKITYLQLGKYETIDQIETAKYLGKQSFVDASRIGIWGWSFGGYISSSCMVKGDGIFKMGIAVAPVTNWRYYDNIYTERFMRTPQENPRGYDDNSPLNFAENFKGNLLLCHGTGDDNVHVQNTMEFSERLVQANKQFEMQLYTNRNHGIYGGNTSYHLYTRMTNYILQKL